MVRKKLGLALAFVLAFTLLAGLTACRKQAETEQIQTAVVKRGDITLKVTADGSLALVQERKLAFTISGTIAEVSVKEGDVVAKGQALARLDTASMEKAVVLAKNGLQAVELALKASQIDLGQAELGVKAAEIDLELATNNYQKIFVPNPYNTYRFVVPQSVEDIQVAAERLREAQQEFQKAVTGGQYSLPYIQEKLDLAQKSLTEAETKLGWGIDAGTRPANADYWTLRTLELQIDKTRLSLDNARDLVSKTSVAIDKSRNDRERAQTELDRATEELGKALIRAPFNGIVARAYIKAGDTISPATTAFHLIDPDQLELEVKVDEMDIPGVRLGQKVSISLDALPDDNFEGKVTYINPLPDVEAGVVSYRVKTGLNIPQDTPLKTGMSATANIIQEERHDVLLVPSRAVKQESQGKGTVEVIVNGQPQVREVVTGISDGFQTEIVSGLNEGDVVVEARIKTDSSSSLLGQ